MLDTLHYDVRLTSRAALPLEFTSLSRGASHHAVNDYRSLPKVLKYSEIQVKVPKLHKRERLYVFRGIVEV